MSEIANINTASTGNINIPGIGKKRITVNDDNEKVLILNVNDANILERVTNGYSELMEWKDKYIAELSLDADEINVNSIESWKKIVAALKPLDKKMRETLDYIFNADISSVCDDGGTMWEVLETGETRFDTLITELLRFYGDNIISNYKKMSERVSDLTKDYVKSDS